MNKTGGLALIFILVIFFSPQCIEEIPFESREGSELLVVNGRVSNLEEEHIVYLSRTVKYGVPPSPVTQAQVSLLESNQDAWEFFESSPGKYILPQGIFKANTGSTYFLKIVLQNGDEYQSDPELILPPITPDSVTWAVSKEPIKSKDGYTYSIDAIQLFIHTPLIENNKNIHLRWTAESAFQFSTLPACNPFKTVYTCYYSSAINPGNLYIYSNQEVGERRLSGIKIGYEAIDPNYKYMETHYFSVHQYRISEQAFDYYRKLDLVANQNGSIFDAIPASVQSNVHNIRHPSERVLGYFQAASASIIRLRLTSSDFKDKYVLMSKDLNLCGWRIGVPDSKYFEGCCNCGALPEPMILRPDWWQ